MLRNVLTLSLKPGSRLPQCWARFRRRKLQSGVQPIALWMTGTRKETEE